MIVIGLEVHINERMLMVVIVSLLGFTSINRLLGFTMFVICPFIRWLADGLAYSGLING